MDCFDALTSDRPYRPRLSDKEALRGSSLNVVDQCRPPGGRSVFEATSRFCRLESAAPSASLLAIGGRYAQSPFSQSQAKSLEDIAGSTEEMMTLFELAQDFVFAWDTSKRDRCDLLGTLGALFRAHSVSFLSMTFLAMRSCWLMRTAKDNASFVAGLAWPSVND